MGGKIIAPHAGKARISNVNPTQNSMVSSPPTPTASTNTPAAIMANATTSMHMNVGKHNPFVCARCKDMHMHLQRKGALGSGPSMRSVVVVLMGGESQAKWRGAAQGWQKRGA